MKHSAMSLGSYRAANDFEGFFSHSNPLLIKMFSLYPIETGRRQKNKEATKNFEIAKFSRVVNAEKKIGRKKETRGNQREKKISSISCPFHLGR